MKFVVKWNNGYWKVFNTVEYTDHMLCYLKTDAEQVAQKLNSKQK